MSGPRLSSESESAAFFAPLLLGHGYERVVAAHLDTDSLVVSTSEGGSPHRDAIELPLRLIVGDALRCEARTVILAHSHPSGDPMPSEADIAATRALDRALHPLGLRLHDHLILTGNGARASFRRLGLL